MSYRAFLGAGAGVPFVRLAQGESEGEVCTVRKPWSEQGWKSWRGILRGLSFHTVVCVQHYQPTLDGTEQNDQRGSNSGLV